MPYPSFHSLWFIRAFQCVHEYHNILGQEEMNSMLDAAVFNKISAHDFISFVIRSETRLGMVVEENGPELWVVHFQRVTAEITRQYSLAPITAAQYPMAYNGNMVEVIGCAADKGLVSRS
jgi:hypothetical protein